MKKILVSCFLLLAFHGFSEENAKTAEVMTKFQKSLYLDVETNSTTIIAVGERGHVAISNDYGETWEQSLNVPTRATLTSVTIQGSDVWAVGHDTTIIHSSDSGKSWDVQFIDVERQMPLLDVLFVTKSKGFAIGAYGTYLTTNDGGKNWDDSLISEEQDFHLNRIIKVDTTRMFVVAEAGNAYRSLDSGETWESIELPYPGSMFGLAYFDNQIVTYGLRGNVLVSNDFGDTFETLDSPVQDSLFGSENISNRHLFIVGANGAFLQYKNNTLTKIDIPNSDGDYTELVSIKENKLIIVGESGISTKKIGR